MTLPSEGQFVPSTLAELLLATGFHPASGNGKEACCYFRLHVPFVNLVVEGCEILKIKMVMIRSTKRVITVVSKHSFTKI